MKDVLKPLHQSGDICFKCLKECQRGKHGDFKSNCCKASIFGRYALENTKFLCSVCWSEQANLNFWNIKDKQSSKCCGACLWYKINHSYK